MNAYYPEQQRKPGTIPGERIWLRGGVALAADAFVGSVNVVHGVHRAVMHSVTRITPAARPVGWGSDFVYARVRDIGRLSFAGVSQLAGLTETLLPAGAEELPQRLSLGLHSAVNGAFGDYLERSGNELAIPMRLIGDDGRPISGTGNGLGVALPQARGRLVLLVHGLGMNEQQWRQGGRADFGARLERDFGYSALRLRYNSGRHISENGRELAKLLETFFHVYPQAVERLTIIGHSMGGLVARSACYYAREAGYRWVDALTDLVLLGSPHLGAPLERLGNQVTLSLTRVSYTQPFAAIGDIRSAGVKDLRYGYLRDEDWQKDGHEPGKHTPSPALPALDHVGYFLVAATLGRREDDPLGRWLGDLLVPIRSAVGHSTVPSGRFPARDQDGRVFYGMNHFALMHHDDVYDAIAEWLEPRLAG